MTYTKISVAATGKITKLTDGHVVDVYDDMFLVVKYSANSTSYFELQYLNAPDGSPLALSEPQIVAPEMESFKIDLKSEILTSDCGKLLVYVEWQVAVPVKPRTVPLYN